MYIKSIWLELNNCEIYNVPFIGFTWLLKLIHLRRHILNGSYLFMDLSYYFLKIIVRLLLHLRNTTCVTVSIILRGRCKFLYKEKLFCLFKVIIHITHNLRIVSSTFISVIEVHCDNFLSAKSITICSFSALLSPVCCCLSKTIVILSSQWVWYFVFSVFVWCLICFPFRTCARYNTGKD